MNLAHETQEDKFSVGLCMKNPGPCRNCGNQTSLMYAVFSHGHMENDRYITGKRISDPLCDYCLNTLGAALIIYPGQGGWARLAYFIPTLLLVGLYCFVAGRLWGYVTTEFIKRIGG